jgi:predicted unusual protein kinase regulating ubiquinone biosynthesis (AarF/ABC1/UbiB family)
VKRVTKEQRITYAKLILAHARDDKEEILNLHFNALPTITQRKDPEIGYLMSVFYNDRDSEDIRQGRNIAEFLDYLEAKDPMVSISEEYLFLCRVNLLLRGMGKAFGMHMRMSKMWEDEAKKLLEREGIKY